MMLATVNLVRACHVEWHGLPVGLPSESRPKAQEAGTSLTHRYKRQRNRRFQLTHSGIRLVQDAPHSLHHHHPSLYAPAVAREQVE